MTWQAIGLMDYVAVTALTVFVLLFDLWLDLNGHEKITTYCRAHPWLAYLILLTVAQGQIGLAVHFMSPVNVEWTPSPNK